MYMCKKKHSRPVSAGWGTSRRSYCLGVPQTPTRDGAYSRAGLDDETKTWLSMHASKSNLAEWDVNKDRLKRHDDDAKQLFT